MTSAKQFSAIQFIGTQRSGSNLLRVMLNQLTEISAPHPPHILKTFFPLLQHYGDLEIKENFYSLTNDVCEWVNVNPVPWKGIVLDAETVIASCQERTLIEIFRRIHELKAVADGARYWCCKSMESVKYVNEIENTNIKPFYIYLYRDGRDVSVSFMKAIVGPKHIYHLAEKWHEEQKQALTFLRTLNPDRFISIKYEQLIEMPQQIMRQLCNGLGVAYQENVIMDYFHSQESINTANSGQMWKNLTNPILKNNHHKYLTELTSEEIEIFEMIAGETLNALGYERMSNLTDLVLKREVIERFDVENMLKMDLSLKLGDQLEVQKRKPQIELLERIQNRVRSFKKRDD